MARSIYCARVNFFEYFWITNISFYTSIKVIQEYNKNWFFKIFSESRWVLTQHKNFKSHLAYHILFNGKKYHALS